MPIVKEFRIPMPVTAEEYQVAQIYMTARAQSMEAEQEDGAGVEVVEGYATTHPKLGKGWYTKKHYHIDRRFPGWLRMVAPKSGTTLIEESYNCFPNTLTTLTLPLFSKFKITVQSTHKNDNGKSENVHGLSPEALKKREVIFLNIAERSEEEKKKKMYEKDTADPSTWTSKRTGRGPLKKGWQDSQQPIMTAYKLVTAEFDYWPIGGRIEEFVHSYEGGVFLSANRQMTCWMDEWHGLTMDDVRKYEDDLSARVNQITKIREGKIKGRIEDLPEVKPQRSEVKPQAPPTSQPGPLPPSPPPVARSSSASKPEAAPTAAEPQVHSREVLLQAAVPAPEQYQQARAVALEVPHEDPQPPTPKREPILPPQTFPTSPSGEERSARGKEPVSARGGEEGARPDVDHARGMQPDVDGGRREEEEEGGEEAREPEMGQREPEMGEKARAWLEQQKDSRGGGDSTQVGGGQSEGWGGRGGGGGSKEPLSPQSPFGEWPSLQVPKFDMPAMPEIPFFPQSPKVLHSPSKRSRDHQRAPLPGETICSAPRCGKYGQYTMVDSGAVVCSIQCKLAFSTLRPTSSVKLPWGWEQRVTADGREYYIDHNTERTQWHSPGPHTR